VSRGATDNFSVLFLYTILGIGAATGHCRHDVSIFRRIREKCGHWGYRLCVTGRCRHYMHSPSHPLLKHGEIRYSYGFREGRSCADAIGHTFHRFSFKSSPQWVLEADIASCFDHISHTWLLENIPVDKKVLSRWLSAGSHDKGEPFPTIKGTPQGNAGTAVSGTEHYPKPNAYRTATR
jgi:hypothetical protein